MSDQPEKSDGAEQARPHNQETAADLSREVNAGPPSVATDRAEQNLSPKNGPSNDKPSATASGAGDVRDTSAPHLPPFDLVSGPDPQTARERQNTPRGTSTAVAERPDAPPETRFAVAPERPDAPPESRFSAVSDASQQKLEDPKAEPLTPQRFAEVGKDVIRSINPDGAPVTKQQLAEALQNPQYQGEQAQALATMYAKFDHLQNISGHRGLFSSRSISGGDLDQSVQVDKQLREQLTDVIGARSWAQDNLKNYAGADGRLRENDINSALNNPNVSSYDRQNLERLQKLMPTAGQGGLISERSIGMDDLKAEEKRLEGTPEYKMVAHVQDSSERAARSLNEGRGQNSLYATPNPLDSIKPDAVKQGHIGNCYFEGALGAVASSNPELIRDAIKDNGDGTYTVTFPGAKNEPITVKSPTPAEMAVFNQSSERGTWAGVMEKAYGQYRENHNWISSYTPQQAADGGGDPGKVLQLLTGRPHESVDLSKASPEDVARHLEQAFSRQPPSAVTAETNPVWGGFFGGGWISDGNTKDDFALNHAFTITGFQPDGKGGGTVQVRNPWGLEDGTTRGNISVSLDKFMKNFGHLKYTK